MVVNDAPQPVNPYVFVRGNRGRRGKEVPRQFLAVLSGPDRKPFAQGSGRLELARAIASPDNPLTARVLVNRVWMHHFGSGLVATPSDFGLRSEPPSHPELLDWLAGAFVRDGWSIKALHRRIMLSSTYRQRSDDVPVVPRARPGQPPALGLPAASARLRVDARRAAGRLGGARRRDGGPAGPRSATRRSRRGAPSTGSSTARTSTACSARSTSPAPTPSCAQRYVTTVPQQALFLMNSPFVIEQAERVAERPRRGVGRPRGVRPSPLPPHPRPRPRPARGRPRRGVRPPPSRGEGRPARDHALALGGVCPGAPADQRVRVRRLIGDSSRPPVAVLHADTAGATAVATVREGFDPPRPGRL